MSLDFSRCRLPPFQHQKEDTERLYHAPYLFITSEMRTGKTKIVIDAAQFLFHDDKIDRVIVVAPAPVRDVWFDPDFGEIRKHLWTTTAADVIEFHKRERVWTSPVKYGVFLGMKFVKARMEWLVTNYEYIGTEARLKELSRFADKRTLLVLDESSYIKNWGAQRTKACVELRWKCGRVVLLNGTPIHHSPLDLFSQGNILSPTILECKFITKFKARYAVQEPVRRTGGGVMLNQWNRPIMKIGGWTNLEDLQRRFAPCTIRRLQKDCLDLPPKLDPVTLTATLTKETWKAYQEMKKDLTVWLSNEDVATAATAATKVLRLSQITSGFIGGIEDARIGEEVLEEGFIESIDLPGSFLDGLKLQPEGSLALHEQHEYFKQLERMPFDVFGPPEMIPPNYKISPLRETTKEIGSEKLEVLLWLIEKRLEEDPFFKLVVWHRFRPEAERTRNVIREKFPQFETGLLIGAQKKEDRLNALRLLHPETSPKNTPVLVSGTAGTGSFGLNFTAAHTCVTMSCGYSPGQAAQMLDRVYGPGQTEPVAYYDIIAVGPAGQKTIDHAILTARRTGEDIATWTSAAWVSALGED